MRSQHTRRFTPVALLLLVAACGGNPSPTVAPPQTQAALYGSRVLDGAAAFQKFVTSQTTAGTIPVELGRKLTSINEEIYKQAGTLREALVAFDAASSLDLRKLEAERVNTQVRTILELLDKVLAINLSPGLVNEATTLITNVIRAITAVQSEIAKGL